MVRNRRSRSIVILVLLGALLEPLGHQLAYLLRYGPSQAARVEAVGAHTYFPRLASFTTITVALVLAAALLVALGVRLTLGRRSTSTPGIGRIFFVLAAVQCGLFAIQESVEAAAIQATPDFLIIALLAFSAQLPVAAVATWLVSRLHGILALAPEAARVILALRLPRPARPIRLQPRPGLVTGAASRAPRQHPRRGPPLPV
ncbi:MAG: hypothetical protein E6J01_11835 [Chloroflexi bacterium]|nr:MAG: hypothetical protein E6J01_11835 [Chloroflexota bacterium]